MPSLRVHRCLQPWQPDLGESTSIEKLKGAFVHSFPVSPWPSLVLPGSRGHLTPADIYMGTLEDFAKARQGQSGTWEFLPDLEEKLPDCLLSVLQMGPRRSAKRRYKVPGGKESTTHTKPSDGQKEEREKKKKKQLTTTPWKNKHLK